MTAKNPWQAGHYLQLLRNGAEFFPALLAQIHAACIEIRLETYIFEPDEIGLAVVQALTQAAQRGVRVAVLIDGFGARTFPDTLRAQLESAGVRFMVFRPEIKRFSLNRSRLRRLHRKLSCFDGEVAFVGGINILSDDDGPGLAPRYDYAVRIVGPVVAEIHETMRRQWRYTGWAQFKQSVALPMIPIVANPAGDAVAALVVRDNARHRGSIEKAYLTAIESAQSEIIIANAYFLPGYRLRQALLRAAKRGVNVVLLLQDERDHALLQYASWAFYRDFLTDGVEIYQYKQGFMHAKVAVIDQQWATVGSSNLDPFSLFLAREANVLVKDQAFAQTLRTDLMLRLQHDALAVLPKHIQSASLGLRMLVWSCFGLVRLLMGISGYGGKKHQE